MKRVVITSSVAAIFYPKSDVEILNYNEEHFSDPDNGSAYVKSKTRAERAAWDFVNGLPE